MVYFAQRRMILTTILVILLPTGLTKPCPPNSIFLYSREHGSNCLRGSVRNVPGFGERLHGFLPSCTDCACVRSGLNRTQNFINGDGFPVHSKDEQVVLFDHQDLGFNKNCRLSFSFQSGQHEAPPAKPLSNLHWIHIPKTGTSFALTIYNYACQGFKNSIIRISKNLSSNFPSVYSCLQCHQPKAICRKKTCVHSLLSLPQSGIIHRDNELFWDKQCVAEIVGSRGHTPFNISVDHGLNNIALFRDPRQRLLSSFNHHRHAFGLPPHLNKDDLKKINTLEEFATFPGIASCQVKHINGYACASDTNITYVQRINLLISSYVRRCNATRSLTNVRPGYQKTDLRDLKTDGYTVLPESAAEELSPQHDPYDWLLYVFLLDIFVENLERYGIAIPEQLKSHWKVVQKGCKIWLSHPEDEQSWTAHAARYCLGIHEIKQNITHRHKHRSTSLDI
eukprot:gene304-3674_t